MLRDAGHQREFEHEGYTVVPFLEDDEVAEVLASYQDLVAEADEDTIAFDYTRDDRAVMAGVRALLEPLFARHIATHFTGHVAVFWTFVIKPPSPNSELSLHDDRTYVDEGSGRACTVWVPLVDTAPELDNGYLCVVPGSHRIMEAPSGTTIPNWFEPYSQYLLDHSIGVAVPAGHALIYDSRTLHWSPPNRSDSLRPAIAVAVVPSGEQLVHVVGEGLHVRRVYAVDREFYVNFHPTLVEQGMPEGYPLLREYHEDRVSAPPEVVARAIGADDLPVPTHEVTAFEPRVYRPEGEEPTPNGEAASTPAAEAPAPEAAPEPAAAEADGTTSSGGVSLGRRVRAKLADLLARP